MTESDPRRRRDPSSISRARRYTPRGRTVREAAEGPEDNRARENGARDREAARRERNRAQQPETEDVAAKRRREAAARSRERRQRETGAIPVEPRPESKSTGSPRTGSARSEPVRRTGTVREQTRRTGAVRPGSTRRTGTVGSQRRPAGRTTGPVPVRPGPRLPRLGNPSRRMRMAAAFVMVLLVLSGTRLIQLQVTDSAAYAAEGLNQRLTTEPLPAARGSILDRDGNRLAYSVRANYIAVDPAMVKGDPAELAAQLAQLLGRPASELEPLIGTKQTPQGDDIRFAYLQRGVDLGIGDQIREMENPGLIIGDDERRVVPGLDLAANVIGFTGGDGGEGLGGLEASYDDWLSGTDGEVSYERSQSGQPIPGAFYREEEAVPGKDIQLTLDADLQFQVQNILEATVQDHDAEFGSALVMEVGTGEMLAMASTPTYNAADPFDVDDPEAYRDYATQATVDPGSIHKAIVFAAALEEGCIEPDGTMPVEQSINKGGVNYTDTYDHGDAVLSLAGIIAQSSNVGTIQLADCIGAEKLYEYQLAFGLGEPTGVGVSGEASGILQEPENWSGTSAGSVPIGHEGTATIMQMAAMYAAIANDGVYVQPTLVDHLVDADGDPVEEESEEDSHRVISTETAQDLQYLLQAPIAAETGTGRNAELENYHLAGKTGTGGLVVDGEYAEGNVASFVGFAPAEDPQYVVAVSVYVPGGGGGGSTTGEAFKEINEFALGYFGVRPATDPAPVFDVWG
ncbi:peptidoglycan D,D-transpeptidase FtsI family protein [Glycomyces harbinensis]|uniref:Cell division protein FtsI (Penicillin-binding protein 3) n=1 Tax=Glycomyces harbinensis TaxID=58114 RepID=A0A1G6WLZ0_9ACTN|nr:penicillin-binding protein 2 [Glycomyces harbinensis]SDD66821.1 cell division protein FtsI (penicillin-binding protein 3) [Glycomyces harbinensis]